MRYSLGGMGRLTPTGEVPSGHHRPLDVLAHEGCTAGGAPPGSHFVSLQPSLGPGTLLLGVCAVRSHKPGPQTPRPGGEQPCQVVVQRSLACLLGLVCGGRATPPEPHTLSGFCFVVVKPSFPIQEVTIRSARIC